MNNKKIASAFVIILLSFSLLLSCGTVEKRKQGSQLSVDAEKLLNDLKGTYQELWPVVFSDKYKQLWLDNCASIVGDDNAEAAFEKLSSSVTGTVIGKDAVEAYKDGNVAYNCEFLHNVGKLTFDGTVISGEDENGNEIFSHSYHYIEIEQPRGLYAFKSDDDNSGEFTYFCIAPDTMDTTWHIAFRYGSDLCALGKYDTGDYAYWLAAGISTDCTEEDIENCINLFCTENLSEAK